MNSEKTRTFIVGTGSYVPENVVKNSDLEKLMDTSDDWIRQRSGIEERRFVAEGTPPSDLALKATERALAAAKLKPQDLDLIIVATLSPEHYFPGTSAFLQKKLGLTTTPSFDLRAQCSGFIYGLDVANALIVSETYRRILLVGVEIQSVALEMNDRGRDMAVLFGDGAGAVILEGKKAESGGVIGTVIHSQGEFGDKLWMEFPTTKQKPVVTPEALAEGRIHPKMDGKFVFKNAVTRIPEVVGELLQKTQTKKSDVNFFLFHQANLRINEFVAQSMQISADRTYNNIQKYGNTSAASIPILLDECVREGKIKKGDTVCLAAFGAGFTWGASLLKL